MECAFVERWQCHNPLHGDFVTGEYQRYHDLHIAYVNRSYQRDGLHVHGNGNKRSRNRFRIISLKRNHSDNDGRSPDRRKRDGGQYPGGSIVECPLI